MPKKHKPLNFAAVYLRGFLIFTCVSVLQKGAIKIKILHEYFNFFLVLI